MSFLHRRERRSEIENDLRRLRPEPRDELVRELATRVESRRPERRGGRMRVGAAVALTAGLVAALAATGGISYAASGAAHAFHAVAQAVFHFRPHQVGSVSAAADQYGKVTLCHNGHEISVDERAVPAHLAQGDTFGTCPAYKPPVKVTGNTDVDLSKSHVSQTIYAPTGNHKITTGTTPEVIRLGTGKNTITSGGNDKIYTGKGDNHIVDHGGHDVIFAGPGNNVINIRNGKPDFVTCAKGGHNVVYADPVSLDYVSKDCTSVYRAPYKR